ncbi:unnamed protein product [Rhizophagus irregularis]|nr:unnamed protein product [Rhizophagus irregularis]
MDGQNSYKLEYIQDNSRRFSAALISYHYLLHISTSIHNTGPAWATWQYPMERLCGMLVPLYKAEVNQKVFGNKLRELSTAERTKEELYSLSCKYCMNRTELQRFRAYYVTILNKPADQLMPITDSIQNICAMGQPSEHDPLKFWDLGAFEVINISAIDRNVGFLKMPNNELYIIDRENRVKFK